MEKQNNNFLFSGRRAGKIYFHVSIRLEFLYDEFVRKHKETPKYLYMDAKTLKRLKEEYSCVFGCVNESKFLRYRGVMVIEVLGSEHLNFSL